MTVDHGRKCRRPYRVLLALAVTAAGVLAAQGCGDDDDGVVSGERQDQAYMLEIPLSGSLQNPAFSPDGSKIVFTRFRNGYNEGPADLYIFDLDTEDLKELVSDGSDNVNLPGSAWNEAESLIVFSSSRDPHDEIYVIDADGEPGDEVRVTDRQQLMAYEPSFSPDGQEVVYESHPLDVEEQGVITLSSVANPDYLGITQASDDCRQPNWSPDGGLVVFQRLVGGQWDLWTISPDGSNMQQLTSGAGDKTDASFGPDGTWVVFSADGEELEFANIFAQPVSGGAMVRLTYFGGYDGAPSVSPDGDVLAFESYPGDPDDSSGTKLWALELGSWPPAN